MTLADRYASRYSCSIPFVTVCDGIIFQLILCHIQELQNCRPLLLIQISTQCYIGFVQVSALLSAWTFTGPSTAHARLITAMIPAVFLLIFIR